MKLFLNLFDSKMAARFNIQAFREFLSRGRSPSIPPPVTADPNYPNQM